MVEGKVPNKKTEEKTLDRIVSEAQLVSCSIVSKTGLHVAGDSNSPQKKETFAAMAAIVFSAAEALKSDVKDGRVTNIVTSFDSSKIVFAPINSNYILVGITREADVGEKVIKSMDEGAARLRKEAPWLN
ncbi:MAG: roadblock/LC7 domain-containing protein [Thermoplasmata archaeon]|nr:roadblock/LC7 domain-containing protein [Candidatus Sysuiplasma acidicola]MBX8638103.1 roadblock/LC7 domain-containing protein [Candidatus Sysuiplasma acidicola]MBX8646738.1 roadblock/LC7 domain-containing protein [Candidatus Sysuiplasma acidicola]